MSGISGGSSRGAGGQVTGDLANRVELAVAAWASSHVDGVGDERLRELTGGLAWFAFLTGYDAGQADQVTGIGPWQNPPLLACPARVPVDLDDPHAGCPGTEPGGSAAPPGHDAVPATLVVHPAPGRHTVKVTVEQANVRFRLNPGAARSLARSLVAAAHTAEDPSGG
ncbi:MAG TPA: hypothetical protein VGS19_20365 [Streptosporangiaceae bacterium]|nr:hypothetical protein [Streptosporangiaceae bacterium]